MNVSYLDRLRARSEFVHPWKPPFYAYHKAARELWRDRYVLDYGDVSNPVGRALVLEHVRPFYRPPTKYDPRPGRWSKVRNVEILNELGIEVDIYDISTQSVRPDEFDQYDLLFGSGPNFESFTRELPPDATKIYYTGGAHYEQVTQQYTDRLEQLQGRRGVEVDPGRPGLFDPDVSLDSVDVVLAMGDDLVEGTYTDRSDVPVYTIRTTHTPHLDFDVDGRDYETSRENFLWFGGRGPIFKGLDLVLEAFEDCPDLDLYVVGPYDHHEDFLDLYGEQLANRENVHPMGYVDLRSPLFRRLVRNCSFLVFPSASEGSSGSVAACMWRGVVPVSPPEVMESTDGWGITLEDDSVDGIRRTVRECASMPPEGVRELSRNVYDEARRRYDREQYSERMLETFLDIFDRFDVPHVPPSERSSPSIEDTVQ